MLLTQVGLQDDAAAAQGRGQHIPVADISAWIGCTARSGQSKEQQCDANAGPLVIAALPVYLGAVDGATDGSAVQHCMWLACLQDTAAAAQQGHSLQ
jgi:hypothetical protein